MPLDIATQLSAWCWRRLAPIVNPKRHNRALDNLRIAFPEKSEEERKSIALEHWENLGRVMAETMRIDQVVADPSRLTIRNPEVFQRYASKLGPIVGAALVVVVKNVVSGYIERWNFLLGTIFVAIVILMPEGLVPGFARLWRQGRQALRRRKSVALAEHKPAEPMP